MGYDVSFHPISPEEMREWYFTPLSWVQQGQEEKVLALAAQHGMEDFYAEKYLDTLRVGAGTEPDELFDKNYCSGVYLSPKQVTQLLRDLEQDPKVLEDLEGLWSNGQLAVLKKALTAAAELGVGLLEATEVVEPNPIRPNESTSYSNLYHCDRDGVHLYIDTVSTQLADVIGKSEEQA